MSEISSYANSVQKARATFEELRTVMESEIPDIRSDWQDYLEIDRQEIKPRLTATLDKLRAVTEPVNVTSVTQQMPGIRLLLRWKRSHSVARYYRREITILRAKISLQITINTIIVIIKGAVFLILAPLFLIYAMVQGLFSIVKSILGLLGIIDDE